MKYRLLELLRDPNDGSRLRLVDETVEDVHFKHRLTSLGCRSYCALRGRTIGTVELSSHDCDICFGKEITAGTLLSESGRRYPVVRGIPRLLASAPAGWLEKNQATFSLEWRMFRDGERNWGQDIAHRKDLFLRGIGLSPVEMRGRVLLDAGCGSGALSIEVSKAFGVEVIAFDLAFGIDQAYERNEHPFVYFVQASVLEPPVAVESCDMVYCAGVLVHIPDGRLGFKALLPSLKPGGRCFIWVYHPIDLTHHPKDRAKMVIYNWIRRRVTSRLPIGIQSILYTAAIPAFMIKQFAERLVGQKRTSLSWREKVQDLTDMFSPAYQNRYTESEILRWFSDEAFEEPCIAYQEEYGFGARAVKASNPTRRPQANSASRSAAAQWPT